MGHSLITHHEDYRHYYKGAFTEVQPPKAVKIHSWHDPIDTVSIHGRIRDKEAFPCPIRFYCILHTAWRVGKPYPTAPSQIAPDREYDLPNVEYRWSLIGQSLRPSPRARPYRVS